MSSVSALLVAAEQTAWHRLEQTLLGTGRNLDRVGVRILDSARKDLTADNCHPFPVQDSTPRKVFARGDTDKDRVVAWSPGRPVAALNPEERSNHLNLWERERSGRLPSGRGRPGRLRKMGAHPGWRARSGQGLQVAEVGGKGPFFRRLRLMPGGNEAWRDDHAAGFHFPL
jgi:hypothetical protein